MLNQSPINLPPQIQNISTSSTNIIQWNIQGIAKKKAELLDLTAKETQHVLYIQEITLPKLKKFNWKNYSGLFKEGHTNYPTHGGAEIFIPTKN